MKVQSASVASALLLLAAVPAANAADATGWSYLEKPNAHVIYTSATDAPGLAIICTSDGAMAATVSLEAGDMLDKLMSDSNRARGKTGNLTVGDVTEKIAWTYKPATQLVSPRDAKYARRLYNAAVTGDTVTVDVSFKDAVQLSLPSIDDSFTQFAQACQSTN